MAGSYSHAVADDGQLLVNEEIVGMLENGGDWYEFAEEVYGMLWFLADGDPEAIEDARARYRDGLAMSPGVEGHNVRDADDDEWSRPHRS